MNQISVNVEIAAKAASSYPIYIAEDLMQTAGEYIKQCIQAKRLFVVTNTTVRDLYEEKFKKSLELYGFEYEFFVLEDGEKYKTVETLNKIWDAALRFRLERKDSFVALGGGVVGDITGFAASSYLRGIDFVQVPTTLLAQVDSSVGGKVAVNHPLGKNMIGAFYQPKVVLADISVLNTLPERELKTGLAEVLKYGFIEKTCGINTDKFLEYLKKNAEAVLSLDKDAVSYMVEHSCKLKAGVVNQDEKEKGLRAILNLGHTIGHAIERCTNYSTFTHGEAVAIGIKGVFLISRALNLIGEKYLQYAFSLIESYGLEYKIPKDILPEDILAAMMHDKKVESGKKRFVLPVERGEVKVFDDVDDKVVLAVLSELY